MIGERLGPGRLVLVAGPSGSGKDTLIRAARDALAGDDRFVFPRRTITRPASASEDNEPCGPEEFAGREAAGEFAASWVAHGLSYGLPASIESDVVQGRTVICNVSRSVVPGLRGRFANVVLAEITAPPEVLRERIAGRGRAQDGNIRERLERSVGVDRPDLTIVNAGSIEDALRPFLRLLGEGLDAPTSAARTSSR